MAHDTWSTSGFRFVGSTVGCRYGRVGGPLSSLLSIRGGTVSHVDRTISNVLALILGGSVKSSQLQSFFRYEARVLLTAQHC